MQWLTQLAILLHLKFKVVQLTNPPVFLLVYGLVGFSAGPQYLSAEPSSSSLADPHHPPESRIEHKQWDNVILRDSTTHIGSSFLIHISKHSCQQDANSSLRQRKMRMSTFSSRKLAWCSRRIFLTKKFSLWQRAVERSDFVVNVLLVSRASYFLFLGYSTSLLSCYLLLLFPSTQSHTLLALQILLSTSAHSHAEAVTVILPSASSQQRGTECWRRLRYWLVTFCFSSGSDWPWRYLEGLHCLVPKGCMTYWERMQNGHKE